MIKKYSNFFQFWDPFLFNEHFSYFSTSSDLPNTLYFKGKKWKDKSNAREALLKLMKNLNFTSFEDLYILDRKHFLDNGFRSLIFEYEDATTAIMEIFPEYPWKAWKFPSGKFFKQNENFTLMKY